MKMNLTTNKKYLQQKFSRKVLVPQNNSRFYVDGQQVTSLLHVNSLW